MEASLKIKSALIHKFLMKKMNTSNRRFTRVRIRTRRPCLRARVRGAAPWLLAQQLVTYS